LGTTGESPCITEVEFEALIDQTISIANNQVPIFIGVGGNFTKRTLKKLKLAEKYKIDGILSVCPYYNRPDQNGLYHHIFTNIRGNRPEHHYLQHSLSHRGQPLKSDTFQIS
jgi:4-hydroxy-tetrahydrodipicolinate synthase